MIVEYSKTGKEVKRYDSFSPRKVKALYKKYGEPSVNSFLDHLSMYGEARLRPLDASLEDNGVLFKQVNEGDEGASDGRGGTGTTGGAPGNTGSGSGISTGNSGSVAT